MRVHIPTLDALTAQPHGIEAVPSRPPVPDVAPPLPSIAVDAKPDVRNGTRPQEAPPSRWPSLRRAGLPLAGLSLLLEGIAWLKAGVGGGRHPHGPGG